MHSILIVDDMESIHEMLDTVVQPLGYTTLFAESAEAALEIFKAERPQIVLTDIKMAPTNGLEFAATLKKIDPEIIIIMMSGFASIENALQSLKLGVFDFLTKPFKVDQLMSAINRASQQLKAGQNDQEGKTAFALLGSSPALRSLKESINRTANSATPALITGKPGTRKTDIASQIHFSHDARKPEAPFIVFDCKDAHPNTVIEQIQGRNGDASLFDQADGGTLLFANIDGLPAGVQTEVGDLIRDARTQTRILSSTSKNLEEQVERGEFDESLYYRISSQSVEVPSLRERSEDIPMIANAILRDCEMSHLDIADQARSLLQSYDWPGNIDELQDAIEDAAAQCEDQKIHDDDLPERIRNISSWSNLAEHLEQATHEYKRRILQACQGDTQRAAEILGCSSDEL